MKTIITNSFNITKNNLMLMQPLILYMLVISLAVIPLKNVTSNSLCFYAILINLGLMTSAFCAGWFGMIKKAVIDFYNKDQIDNRTEYSIKLLKEFFPSVGNYFVPTIFAFLIFSVLGYAFSILIYKIAIHLFSSKELILQFFNTLSQSFEVQQNFLTTLTDEKLLILNKSLLFFAFCYFIFNISTLFYLPALFFKTKNPFKALFYALKTTIKRPLYTIGIYVFLTIMGFFVSSIGLIGNINIILSLITLFITIMFFTYYIVVLFLSYERYNNCNNGSNSEREIESCN